MSEHSETDIFTLHGRTATECNNAAWDLIEHETLDTGDCVELVRLAATAAYHWREIGSADNIASAELLLGWALARAGAAAAAVDTARRAFAYFSGQKSQGSQQSSQMAFAHATMAVALHCAGDQDGYRQHYGAAKRLGANLPAGDIEYFEAAFRTIPRPAD